MPTPRTPLPRAALAAVRKADHAAKTAASIRSALRRLLSEAESITMRYATPPEPRIGDPVIYQDAPGRVCAATIIDVLDEAAAIVTLQVTARDGTVRMIPHVARGDDVGNWTWRDD